MMKRYLAVMGVLVGCAGENFDSGDRNTSSSTNEDTATEEGTGDTPTDVLAPDASITIYPITCERTIARYEAYGVGPNEVCKWTFDDGSTSNECAGEHEFDVAGDHYFVLEVTDLVTGATGIDTQTRFFWPPLELTLDVTTNDDLSISYVATANDPGNQYQVVHVEPAELVVSDHPDYPRVLNDTVRVLEPGTYTVTFDYEDERGVSEICAGQVVKQVTVAPVGCPDAEHDHDHDHPTP